MGYSVYKHWDKDGVLLYVGQCKNLKQRTAAHNGAHWFKNIAEITSEIFPNKQTALAEEKRLIQTEMPLYNTVHHPDREPLMNPLPEPPEHIGKSGSDGFTIHYVRYKLSKKCYELGGVREWAKKNKIAWAYVYAVIRGAQKPSKKLLKKIGMKMEYVLKSEPLNPMANVQYD